jgi:hypothetical protein
MFTKPMNDQLIENYQNGIRSLIGSSRSLGVFQGDEPIFASCIDILTLESFGAMISEDRIELLLNCESLRIRCRRNQQFILLGMEVCRRWAEESSFSRWPFMPLMSDAEGSMLGFIETSSAGIQVACISKDAIYEERFPSDPLLGYKSSKPLWEIPRILKQLIKNDEPIVLYGLA